MRGLLADIALNFFTARVVVTGYYPIVSEQSSLADLQLLLLAAGVLILPADPITGGLLIDAVFLEYALEHGGSPDALRSTLAQRAQTFYSTATAGLRSAVNAINASFHRDYRFADPGFAPDNAYGAANSWLYRFSDAASPVIADPAASDRRQACAARYGLLKPDYTVGGSWTDRVKCPVAAMGHPNRLGALAYATAITNELQTLIPSC
jgi:hypothetical protein